MSLVNDTDEAAAEAPAVLPDRRHLVSYLTAEQAFELGNTGAVTVVNEKTGNSWVLDPRFTAGNIRLLKIGDPTNPPRLPKVHGQEIREGQGICVYTCAYNPEAATWTPEAKELNAAAQYLALRYYEEHLLSQAYFG